METGDWLRSVVRVLLGWTGAVLLASFEPAAGSLTWLWANPLAHGNNIYDMAYRNGLTVQAGDRGRLYTSLDRNLWVMRETRTTNALRAATFFQNRLLVTGESGTVVHGEFASLTNLAAPAPLTLVDLGTSDWIEGVAASATTAVAVGDNGAIYTTANGADWTRRPQSFSTWLHGVAYGQNTFVVVGAGGFLATSPEGIRWTRRTSGTTANLNRVAWVGAQWLAVGDGGVMLRSSNATQWSSFSPSPGATGDLYFVTGSVNFGGSFTLVGGASELRLYRAGSGWSDETTSGKHLAAPKHSYYCGFWDGLYYSVGGPSGMVVEGVATNLAGTSFAWLPSSPSIRTWLWDLAKVGPRFYAVGDLGTIQSSSDGVNWELELVPGVATNAVLLGVGGRPDCIVVAGTKGTLLTSTNGLSWSAVNPAGVGNDLQGVTVFNGEIYVTGGAGAIISSADGRSWRYRVTLPSAFLSSIGAGPRGLACVGADGSVFTSPNGSLWTLHRTGTTNWLSRVRFLAGQWLAVGEQGTILGSVDGTNWTSRASGTVAWLNDVAHFDGAFYAAGTQGTLLMSPDATNWSSAGVITQKSLYAMAVDPHQLITVGIEGIILRGQTEPLAILQYQRTQGTNVFRLSGPPGRAFNLEKATGLTGWTDLSGGRFLDNSGTLIVGESRANAPARENYRGRLAP